MPPLRRLEEVAKAVGGSYCRLQMPLKLALAVRGTLAGHRQAPRGGGGGYPPVSVGLLSLSGALESHPFFPSCAESGCCVLTAAAAGVPCGVVSLFKWGTKIFRFQFRECWFTLWSGPFWHFGPLQGGGGGWGGLGTAPGHPQ